MVEWCGSLDVLFIINGSITMDEWACHTQVTPGTLLSARCGDARTPHMTYHDLVSDSHLIDLWGLYIYWFWLVKTIPK